MAAAAPALLSPLATLPDRVSGPIAVSARSHPFLAAAHQREPIDLSAHGYIESEYFISGRANVYQYGRNRRVEIRTAASPYTTHVLLRIPADRSRFNGAAVVEIFNPTLRMDLSDLWSLSHDYLMHEGYAYVGVTAKPVNVETLHKFDPQRYAPLSWSNPLPPGQACVAPHPVAALTGHSRPETEDGLVWDVLSELGALIKSSDPRNPLRTYAVKYLYAFGYSQTAGFIGTYALDFQPHVRLPDHRPVFDGFLQGGSAGLTRLNQCAETLAYTDPHIRIHSATPFIRVMTLTDFIRIGPFEDFRDRRGDSDAAGDKFRLYEVAGAAHTTAAGRRNEPSREDLVRIGIVDTYDCLEPFETEFPLGLAFDTALQNLDAWVTQSTPPPRAARILAAPAGSPEAEPVLDALGNAQGGMRTPAIDVPLAAYSGRSTGQTAATALGCRMEGHQTPFTHAQLQELYPTHGDYVGKLEARVQELVAQGWLTPFDAERVKIEGRRQRVP